MTLSSSNPLNNRYNITEMFKRGITTPVIPTPPDDNQLTLPDLHGNVLGAILRLELFGVMKLQEADRVRLAEIYARSGKLIEEKNEFIFGRIEKVYKETGKCTLTDDDYNEFKEIIDRATFDKDKFKCVRFIGDVLGDRGKNDILMLYLFGKLDKKDVNIEVTFSNHDLVFLTWHLSEITREFNTMNELQEGQERSLKNFVSFLKDKPRANQHEMENHVSELIDNYKSKIKLIQYSREDKTTPATQFTMFSHAPVGLEAIQGLAELKLFGISTRFDDSSPEKLYDLIDEINKKFQEILISNPTALFNQLKSENAIHLAANRGKFISTNINPRETPLLYIAWNRGTQHIRGPANGNFPVIDIHGHAGGDRSFHDETDPSNPKPAWRHNGVSGQNLDFDNDLGYSEPISDVMPVPIVFTHGWPGAANCFTSQGVVVAPVKVAQPAVPPPDNDNSPTCSIS